MTLTARCPGCSHLVTNCQCEKFTPAEIARNKERIAAMLEAIRHRKTIITARELDAMGVHRWRSRLENAARTDAREGLHRVHFDEAWGEVRTEYFLELEKRKREKERMSDGG